MSDEVRSAVTAWMQAKAVHGEDHPDARNLLSVLEAARRRQADQEFSEAQRRADEARKRQDERLKPQPAPKPLAQAPLGTGPQPPPFSWPAAAAVAAGLVVMTMLLSAPRAPVSGPPADPSPGRTAFVPPPAAPHLPLAPPAVAPQGVPRLIPQPSTEPVRRYGSVWDELLSAPTEVEQYVLMYAWVAEADGQHALGACVHRAYFSSPAATTERVVQLWNSKAPSLANAVDRVIVEPCQAGAFASMPDAAFAVPAEEPNRFAQDMRIRASFAALRAYVARFLRDDAADACLAQQRADMLAALNPMRPTGFPSVVYQVAKSEYGMPPNGLARFPGKAKIADNTPAAAVLRLRMAEGLQACERHAEDRKRACAETLIAGARPLNSSRP